MLFFGFNAVCFSVVAIGAMLATTFTAIAAFQMISFGKNNIAFLAQVIIFLAEVSAF
ncbi:MAG: hypothetical protein RLZZ65_266 [Bacteroidota bacterium]